MKALPSKILLIGPAAPPLGGMALQGQLLADMLRADGNAVTFFAWNRPLPRPFRTLERLPGVRTLARSAAIWARLWKPALDSDVVHVLAASWLYFFTVVLPAVLVSRVCRRRVIVNYRGGEAKRFFDRYGWLARPVFKLADVTTAPSEFVANTIESYFHVPVQVVPNILDRSLFQYRERESFEPRFIVARQLEKSYDVESVLRAFRIVQSRHPDASLIVAGDGKERGRLEDLARAWQLNVQFLGNVAHDQLPAIYDRCDIFVNASRIDNFPSALLEASAVGLVIVSSAAGGIPVMYEDGTNALLVEPGDWEQLAEAMAMVLARPALAQNLARQALAVVRRCEWAHVRAQVYKAYGLSMTPDTFDKTEECGRHRCTVG